MLEATRDKGNMPEVVKWHMADGAVVPGVYPGMRQRRLCVLKIEGPPSPKSQPSYKIQQQIAGNRYKQFPGLLCCPHPARKP